MAALRTALGLDRFDPERRELSDYNCDGAVSVECGCNRKKSHAYCWQPLSRVPSLCIEHYIFKNQKLPQMQSLQQFQCRQIMRKVLCSVRVFMKHSAQTQEHSIRLSIKAEFSGYSDSKVSQDGGNHPYNSGEHRKHPVEMPCGSEHLHHCAAVDGELLFIRGIYRSSHPAPEPHNPRRCRCSCPNIRFDRASAFGCECGFFIRHIRMVLLDPLLKFFRSLFSSWAYYARPTQPYARNSAFKNRYFFTIMQLNQKRENGNCRTPFCLWFDLFVAGDGTVQSVCSMVTAVTPE